jgi:hypothetical protein
MSFRPKQEPEVVDGARLAWIAGVSIAITIVAIFVAWGIERVAMARPHDFSNVPAPPPLGTTERTLVAVEPGRGVEERRAQREELTKWGWADRDAGIAHIPIDRAVDLWLAQQSQEPQPQAAPATSARPR